MKGYGPVSATLPTTARRNLTATESLAAMEKPDAEPPIEITASRPGPQTIRPPPAHSVNSENVRVM